MRSACSFTTTTSPADIRWRLGTTAPSTATAPASIRRCARAREPSGVARNASRRSPPSASVAFSSTGFQDVEEREYAERDRDVGDVERRPRGELDEVRHGAVADAVEDVAHRTAEQQAGREPCQRRGRVTDEPQDERHERHADDERDDRAAAGEGAKGDAVIAHVDKVY